MKLLYLAMSFLSIFFLDIYLKINIVAIGSEGGGLQFLLIFIFLAFILFVWRLKTSRSVIIRPSMWFFYAFIYYFVFRIAMDWGSIDRLKAFTIATSSGLIFFYVVGALVSIILGRHTINAAVQQSYLKYYRIFMIIFIIYSVISLLFILYDLGSRVRSDIILLADGDGDYQRPGNFLIISYLLLLALYTQHSSLKKINIMSPKCLLFDIFAIIIFIFYTLVSLFLSQLIGSNSAAVIIAGLAGIFITLTNFFSIKYSQFYLSMKKLRPLNLIHGGLLYRLIFFMIINLMLLIVCIAGVSDILGIDLSMTRLGGFGSGHISSIDSRFKLLSNFAIHFSNSPLLGNMAVDCLTTGCGSYVHSLPASLLTHTGIIGFLLFFIFLFLNFNERFSRRILSYRGALLSLNVSNIFAFANMLFIILIASLANFLTWSVLWFSLGLFSLGLFFKNR